jgi:tubulin epsilon
MPRELITIQVGQCGNQIGYRFWDLVFREHSQFNKSHIYDDALSSFFRNTDSKSNHRVGSKITDLKARAIIVDMEEGAISQIMRS